MKEIIIEGWVQYHPNYKHLAGSLGYDGDKYSIYECLDQELCQYIREDNESEPEGSKNWIAVKAKLIVLVED